MDNSKNNIESPEALNELLKDLYKAECKKSTQYMVAAYILTGLLFIAVLFSCYLLNELNSYEQVTITTTKTTTETFNNDVEGDDANIVNGDQYQYNDSAVHNQNTKEDD